MFKKLKIKISQKFETFSIIDVRPERDITKMERELSEIEDYKELNKVLGHPNPRSIYKKNFRSVLNLINDKRKENKDLAVVTVKLKDHILIGYKSIYNPPFYKDLEILALYKPETQSVMENFLKITNLSQTKDFDMGLTNMTFMNYYTYYIPLEFIDLILTAGKIQAAGEDLYHSFRIPKKSGGMREIKAPHEDLKESLKNVNVLLQKMYDNTNDNFQVAYKKGKSIVDNAKLHVDNKYVFNIDIEDFFPSCTKEYVVKYLSFATDELLYGDEILEMILETILIDDALYIGNPVSGTLANIIISEPVNHLRNMAKKTGVELSVYADDITFSSNKFIAKGYVTDMFEKAFKETAGMESFNIKDSKSHGMSGDRRRITGVTINHRNEMTVSRKFYKDIRVKVHKLSINQPIQGTVETLIGQIAHAMNVDHSGKIRNLVDKFESTFIRHGLMSGPNIDRILGRV